MQVKPWWVLSLAGVLAATAAASITLLPAKNGADPVEFDAPYFAFAGYPFNETARLATHVSSAQCPSTDLANATGVVVLFYESLTSTCRLVDQVSYCERQRCAALVFCMDQHPLLRSGMAWVAWWRNRPFTMGNVVSTDSESCDFIRRQLLQSDSTTYSHLQVQSSPGNDFKDVMQSTCLKGTAYLVAVHSAANVVAGLYRLFMYISMTKRHKVEFNANAVFVLFWALVGDATRSAFMVNAAALQLQGFSFPVFRALSTVQIMAVFVSFSALAIGICRHYQACFAINIIEIRLVEVGMTCLTALFTAIAIGSSLSELAQSKFANVALWINDAEIACAFMIPILTAFLFFGSRMVLMLLSEPLSEVPKDIRSKRVSFILRFASLVASLLLFATTVGILQASSSVRAYVAAMTAIVEILNCISITTVFSVHPPNGPCASIGETVSQVGLGVQSPALGLTIRSLRHVLDTTFESRPTTPGNPETVWESTAGGLVTAQASSTTQVGEHSQTQRGTNGRDDLQAGRV